jgi:hypothetical protein
VECSTHKKGIFAKFATILQIIYQREQLTCFSKKIAITFDLANKGNLLVGVP